MWLHLPYAHARLIAAGYLLWLAVLMFVTAFLRDVHEFEKARAGSADAQRVHADGCVR